MWNNLSLKNRLTTLGILTITILSVLLGGGLIYFTVQSFSYDAFMNATNLDEASASASIYQQYLLETRERYIIQSLSFVVLLSILGMIVFWLVLQYTMRPIQELTSKIDDLETSNLPQEIILKNKNRETRKLESSFNNLLNQINATLDSQKHFVSNAAHELKTPLTSILTNIDVLEMDDNPSKEEYREVLSITRDNIERMSNLVKDMLDLTQLQKQNYEQFNLRQLTLINDEMKKDIANKNINFIMIGDTTINGNRALIERAIQNLIGNAIRYSEKGGSIEVKASQNEIEIKDTGIGIPFDQQDKVFEPFYCVNPSRSRKLGGSGLGLSIVHQILTAHGMSIHLKSQENIGTTFTITL